MFNNTGSEAGKVYNKGSAEIIRIKLATDTSKHSKLSLINSMPKHAEAILTRLLKVFYLFKLLYTFLL